MVTSLAITTPITTPDPLADLVTTIEEHAAERGNIGVVRDEGWRIEMMDRGTRYIYRRGSRGNRESARGKGGKVSDGAISAERLARWQHRSNVRRAKSNLRVVSEPDPDRA